MPEVAADVGFDKKPRVAKREQRETDSEIRNPNSAIEEAAAGNAVDTFRESMREEKQPIERDDREARQLLQLSQLEGRDPLQDALAGRLALDRLDEIAESDRDPKQAEWADDLRRELRERFNEVAPTKFSLGAGY